MFWDYMRQLVASGNDNNDACSAGVFKPFRHVKISYQHVEVCTPKGNGTFRTTPVCIKGTFSHARSVSLECHCYDTCFYLRSSETYLWRTEACFALHAEVNFLGIWV